ncbi:MAG: (2Fe-2S)-binding protein [Planctomycetales bacterium]|nr:(2Fe-2S)-binding protein [Planctomycetales bacterium]
MENTFTIQVNGRNESITTDPERPLLDVLREDLGLTGTKFGCGEGQCSACSVLVDGKRVRSCVTPIGKLAGKKILTIEGLSNGDSLHPIQEAFLSLSAFQCGYCTPGMIMRTVELLENKPNPTDEEILNWMESNLCRCCGYPKILEAIQSAAKATAKGDSQ